MYMYVYVVYDLPVTIDIIVSRTDHVLRILVRHSNQCTPIASLSTAVSTCALAV